MEPTLLRRHQFTVSEPGPLFASLSAHLSGLSRHQARLAVMAGLAKVAGKICSEPKQALGTGVAVELDLRQGIPSAGALRHRHKGEGAVKGAPFTVLHRDDDVLVVDKATGVVSAPVGKDSHGHIPELLREAARRQGKRLPFLGLLHRIDAATSGCLCFALNKKAQEILGVQFAHHAAERRYRAIVLSGPLRDADTLTGNIGRGKDGRRRVVEEDAPGKSATTHFEVLRRFHGYSDVACRLETGRTHQIRVHLAAIGCPVLGDPVYGPRGPGAWAGAPRVRRLMLHAEKLIFDHPTTGARTTVTAPLPVEFKELLEG